MFKGKFKDIVLPEEGFLRGPFGSALKKSLFVPKSKDTYKVYEQGVVLEENKNIGNYYITKQYFEDSLSRFQVKSGDFLVSCSGVNYGAIFQLTGEIERGVINQALLRIRLNNNIVDDTYFLYYFKAYIVKVITGGTGDSTIPNFPPMSFVKDIDIELPDLETQKRIGMILNSIDEKFILNNKINAELESMAKTIYDYWFLQFEFPNEEGKPYKSYGGKMVWNEELKRKIPEGWEVGNITDFGSLGNGINYDKNEVGDKTYKIINVRDISSTSLILNKKDMSDITLLSKKANNYLIENNDIIIARSGIPGAVRILEDNIDNTIFCGFIIRLKLKNDLYRSYLVYKLKDYEHTTVTTSGGTIMQNVNQDTLKRIKFAIPSNDIILLFNEKIKTIWSLMQEKLLENQELESLRDFLLPILMNGHVGFKEEELADADA